MNNGDTCVNFCGTWPCYFAKRAKYDSDVTTQRPLYWFQADPDPAFYLKRIRIQVAKPMRIHADPDSDHKRLNFYIQESQMNADQDPRGSGSTTMLVCTVRYWNFQHQHYSKPWRFTLWFVTMKQIFGRIVWKMGIIWQYLPRKQFRQYNNNSTVCVKIDQIVELVYVET
jgi:hypothetical protein